MVWSSPPPATIICLRWEVPRLLLITQMTQGFHFGLRLSFSILSMFKNTEHWALDAIGTRLPDTFSILENRRPDGDCCSPGQCPQPNLQYTAVHHTKVHYSIVQYSTVQCGAVLRAQCAIAQTACLTQKDPPAVWTTSQTR